MIAASESSSESLSAKSLQRGSSMEKRYQRFFMSLLRRRTWIKFPLRSETARLMIQDKRPTLPIRKKTPIRRPGSDWGTRSPYPTVVSVTTRYQSASCQLPIPSSTDCRMKAEMNRTARKTIRMISLFLSLFIDPPLSLFVPHEPRGSAEGRYRAHKGARILCRDPDFSYGSRENRCRR